MFIRRIGMVALMVFSAGCAPVKHAPVVVQASRLTSVPLTFPAQAIRQRHQGMVIAFAFVGTDGRVDDVKIQESSGFRELDMAAIAAVRQWTFRPKTIDGVAVAGYVRVPVDFKINEERPPAIPMPSTNPYTPPVRAGMVPPPPPPPPSQTEY